MCLAYTSRHEISRVGQSIIEHVRMGRLSLDDIDEGLMERALGCGPSNGPMSDLYVRTSGEVRLSDFLLWQSGYSMLENIDIKWPEISFWSVVASVIRYQFNFFSAQKTLVNHQTNRTASPVDAGFTANDELSERRLNGFLQRIEMMNVDRLYGTLDEARRDDDQREPLPPFEV